MFGLFTPRCPLPTAEKVWTERRMRWLADRLGRDRLRDARVVLPTAEFFPDPFARDAPSVRRMLDRVCRYMRVDPARLGLSVLPDAAMPGAAGLYAHGTRSHAPVRREPATVFVAESQLATPVSLVATLAHEVGHEILLGGDVLSERIEDHERITDLLTVFLGFGVFNANAALTEAGRFDGSGHPVGSVSRFGYLSVNEFGYALAVFAHARGEARPAWARQLRPDARAALRRGLRYQQKTGDTLFGPDTPEGPRAPPTVDELLAALCHTSATVRLGALHDLTWAGADGPELIAAVCRVLDDPDAGVRAEAPLALATFGEGAAPGVPRLLALVRAEADSWPHAAWALAVLRAEPDAMVPELARLLKRHPLQVHLLVEALRFYGEAAAPAVPELLDALGREVLSGTAAGEVLRTCRALLADPETTIREHFARDAEVLRLVSWELRQPIP